MPRVRCHRRGKQNPPASGAQTETPRNSSRLENSPGIRSEIVPLPLGAPSRPPQVAGRDATIHHMGLPGTTGSASDSQTLPFARDTYFLRYCFYGTMTTRINFV